jgi:8-oxo-dGTP pyrophosphatase MutT (NUDIX family)
VNVVAISKDNKLVLIQQFRYGENALTLEIPGGMIDKDDTPLETAKRELEEETGFTAGNIIPLGFSVPNPAIQANRMHHFLATDCVYTKTEKFDEHESIVTRLVNPSDIKGLIQNGEISHSLVLAAFLRFEYYQSSNSKHNYES